MRKFLAFITLCGLLTFGLSAVAFSQEAAAVATETGAGHFLEWQVVVVVENCPAIAAMARPFAGGFTLMETEQSRATIVSS